MVSWSVRRSGLPVRTMATVTVPGFLPSGAPKRRRSTYLLWEEPKGPDFVLELTSRSTRRQDEGFKREPYARHDSSSFLGKGAAS